MRPTYETPHRRQADRLRQIDRRILRHRHSAQRESPATVSRRGRGCTQGTGEGPHDLVLALPGKPPIYVTAHTERSQLRCIIRRRRPACAASRARGPCVARPVCARRHCEETSPSNAAPTPCMCTHFDCATRGQQTRSDSAMQRSSRASSSRTHTARSCQLVDTEGGSQ